MKNNKITLEQIKVESFVIYLEKKENATIHGEINTLISGLFGVLGCLIDYTLEPTPAIESKDYCPITSPGPYGPRTVG